LTVFDLPGHHRHPVRGTLPHRRPPPPRRGAPEPSRRPQAALRRRDTGLSRAGVGWWRSQRRPAAIPRPGPHSLGRTHPGHAPARWRLIASVVPARIMNGRVWRDPVGWRRVETRPSAAAYPPSW